MRAQPHRLVVSKEEPFIHPWLGPGVAERTDYLFQHGPRTGVRTRGGKVLDGQKVTVMCVPYL